MISTATELRYGLEAALGPSVVIAAIAMLALAVGCVPDALPTPTAAIEPEPTYTATATASPTPSPPTATATATPSVTPSPSAAPTEATQLRCCWLAEGVFRTIRQNNPETTLGCPTSGHPRVLPLAFEVKTSYQSFERGAMLWSNKTGWYGESIIYVLYADGSFERFQDTFDPNTDPVIGGETPPAGLIEPSLGFGKVWRKEPGVRESLGWATAEETPGPGRFQQFMAGNMIWLSQRGETYVLPWSGRTYTVVNSPTFAISTPMPVDQDPSLLLHSWVPRDVPASESPAALAFTFAPDNVLAFHDCTAGYRLLDNNRIQVDAVSCPSPEIATGVYEYTVDEATLVLRQRFQAGMTGFSSQRWRREGDAYEIELTGSTISVVGGQCSGIREHRQDCTYRIEWTDCEAESPPLADGIYDFTFVGDEFILTRHFKVFQPASSAR